MFPKEKYYFKPIYEKEILEILHAFIKWFPHLIGRHFNIRTYHESVNYFLEQHLSSREHEKLGYTNVTLWIWNYLQKGKKKHGGRWTLRK